MDQYYKAAWEGLTASGAPFAWSVAEVRGVPTRVYDAAPNNLLAIWKMSEGYADRDYLIFGEERISYTESHARASALSAYLASVGVGKGDRVALAMRNYPEWVVAYWATVSLGAVVVGMNAWWTGPEMEYALGDCEASVLVCDAERLERIQPLLDDLRNHRPLQLLVTRCETALTNEACGWNDALIAGATLPTPPEVDIGPDHDLCVFYTSGTTGRPKGAALTHRGAVSNLLNLAFWQAMVLDAQQKAVAAGDPPPGSDKETGASEVGSVLAIPLFHVTGCNCCLHPLTASGGKLILMHKWDAERALELIERERPSTFTGVPTMARELLNSPDFESRDTSSLQNLGGGGAPLQPDLVKKIEDRVKGRPATGYGLTEVNGVITLNAAHFFLAKPESAGSPCPIMESRIVNENGIDLPVGECGELWVRGGNVFRGYLNQPEANAEVLTDGWFHTGDIGYFDDDGFLFLVDRAKDMVLRGGENVYSAEVEAAIYEHPAVSQAAVFAVPDERLGETVGVAVVLLPGSSCTGNELRDHTRGLIAGFKVPEHVWFLEDALPQNANGKFLKRELRDKLLDTPSERSHRREEG